MSTQKVSKTLLVSRVALLIILDVLLMMSFYKLYVGTKLDILYVGLAAYSLFRGFFLIEQILEDFRRFFLEARHVTLVNEEDEDEMPVDEWEEIGTDYSSEDDYK